MSNHQSLYTKWVACWGNATSITDQVEAMYAKNLTLRYPIRVCFSGSAIRLHFSNLTGTEAVVLDAVNIAKAIDDKCIDTKTRCAVTFGGQTKVCIEPGQEVTSDAVDFDVTAGETVSVSIYLKEYTQMNAGVLITGPLSKGFYAYGDFAADKELPLNLSRKTQWFYFLNTMDVLTEEKNHALICFGDSITAQAWPDYLAIRAWEHGYHDIAIIRRAVSGTRILRQYDCITYAAYGLKGETRFPIEMQVAGADRVLIQHGINDIIHPVGVETNVFRPWSDLPRVDEMTEGIKKFYIEPARAAGMQVWGGTLLPIYGWRTYTPFRDELRCGVNHWLRSTGVLDGCVDFDKAVRDEAHPEAFAPGYDSGDHLHPSEQAYEVMAAAVPECLLR